MGKITFGRLLLVFFLFSCISVSVVAVSEYDTEILEEFNRTSEVAVIVKLYFKNMSKVDDVLASLPEQEFKLDGKFQSGRGFYGNITKEGFDILINNSDVRSIYLSGFSYVVGDDENKSEPIMVENDSTTPIPPELEKEPNTVEIKKEKSWFQKIIQFIKSLFGF